MEAAGQQADETQSYLVPAQETGAQEESEGGAAHLVLFQRLHESVQASDIWGTLRTALKDQPGGVEEISEAIEHGLIQMIAGIINHLPSEIERREQLVQEGRKALHEAVTVIGDAVSVVESVAESLEN